MAAKLPQLRGRATVQLELERGGGGSGKGGGGFVLQDGSGKKTSRVVLNVVVDGYHAPLTAGKILHPAVCVYMWVHVYKVCVPVLYVCMR